MTAGNVTPKADPDSAIQQRSRLHDPRDNVGGGVRTVHRIAVILLQDADILFRRENEVRAQDRSVLHQAGSFINLRITGTLREQNPCLLRLPPGFHKVGLHAGLIFPSQSAETLYELS